MTVNDKLKNILDSLDSAEKDSIYRYLWAEHVKEDIESELPAFEELIEEKCGITDLDDPRLDFVVERAAEAYVYHGDYDCNLSYWANIHNCITEAIDLLDLKKTENSKA